MSHILVSYMVEHMLPPCFESAAVAERMLTVRCGTELFLREWFGIERFLPVWCGILSFGYDSRGKRAPRRC